MLKDLVTAQGITTKRDRIAHEQKFRWHSLIDSQLKFVREKTQDFDKFLRKSLEI